MRAKAEITKIEVVTSEQCRSAGLKQFLAWNDLEKMEGTEGSVVEQDKALQAVGSRVDGDAGPGRSRL